MRVSKEIMKHMQIFQKTHFRYRYMLLHCVLCEVVGAMWQPTASTKRFGGGGHIVKNLASHNLDKCKFFKKSQFFYIYMLLLCVGTMWQPAAGTKRFGGGGQLAVQ